MVTVAAAAARSVRHHQFCVGVLFICSLAFFIVGRVVNTIEWF
jgi:hypothetical protein